MFSDFLRNLAWKVILSTNSHHQPHIVFTHRACGSRAVQPMGMYFDTWKTPQYQCFGCNCLTTDVDAKLVNQYDPEIQEAVSKQLKGTDDFDPHTEILVHHVYS